MTTTRRDQNSHESTTAPGTMWQEIEQARQQENALPLVTHGPYEEHLPVESLTVQEIRSLYATRFDIDPQSQAFVNGRPVDESTVIRTGQTLMFTRRAGLKGLGFEVGCSPKE